jgi:hypothetical protein
MEAAGVRPQGAISGPSMHGKAWDACQGKGGTDKGVQLQSPSKGTCSLWSTQDGFAPSCTDPDRDSSIEVRALSPPPCCAAPGARRPSRGNSALACLEILASTGAARPAARA